MTALLEEGADPNHPLFWSEESDSWNYPPLHSACIYNKPEIVKALVQGGADVKKVDKFKQTPLHHASVFGNKEIMQYLVEDIKCEVGEHMNAYILLVSICNTEV